MSSILNCSINKNNKGNPLYKDLKEQAMTTADKEQRLTFLGSTNYEILMGLAKNPFMSDNELGTLAEQNINVPPLLELIKKHQNCSETTKTNIFWNLLFIEDTYHGIAILRKKIPSHVM